MKMPFEDTMISIWIDGVERIGGLERLEKLSAAFKGFEKFGNWQDVEWRGQFVATAEHERLLQK